jgi:hypothetical protein
MAARGRHLIARRRHGQAMGSTPKIMIENGLYLGSADPRHPGALPINL